MDSAFDEIKKLDVDKLQVIYQEEVNRLKNDLLAGSSWDSVRDQKNKVTELAILIHKKKYPLYFNPAEFSNSRKEKGERRKEITLNNYNQQLKEGESRHDGKKIIKLI